MPNISINPEIAFCIYTAWWCVMVIYFEMKRKKAAQIENIEG